VQQVAGQLWQLVVAGVEGLGGCIDGEREAVKKCVCAEKFKFVSIFLKLQFSCPGNL
jgi:hypothetical protein